MAYAPYTHQTPKLLYSLADLDPKTLATMHGSSFYGDCSQALKDLDIVMKELWGGEDKEKTNGQQSAVETKTTV